MKLPVVYILRLLVSNLFPSSSQAFNDPLVLVHDTAKFVAGADSIYCLSNSGIVLFS